MSDKRLGELIESIATHYSAIRDARTELVDRLDSVDIFDSEGDYDFTWIFSESWELVSGDGTLVYAQISCAERGNTIALDVRRDLHPDYVFVQSTRLERGTYRPFIAILRAANEKRTP